MSSDRLQDSRRTEPRLLAALKVFFSAAGECSCSTASKQKQRGFAPELLIAIHSVDILLTLAKKKEERRKSLQKTERLPCISTNRYMSGGRLWRIKGSVGVMEHPHFMALLCQWWCFLQVGPSNLLIIREQKTRTHRTARPAHFLSIKPE